MNTHSKARPDTPAAVAAFMSRHGLPERDLRSDGRLTLTFEGKYRVHLAPAPLNRLAISAQVLDLGGRMSDDATDRLLESLMNQAAGLLQQQPSTLCLDSRRDILMLQRVLPGNVEVNTLEFELAEFVSALGFWTRLGASRALNASA